MQKKQNTQTIQLIKKPILIIIGIIVFVITSLCSFIFLLNHDTTKENTNNHPGELIEKQGIKDLSTINAKIQGREDILLTLEIADTPDKWATGLMGRNSLDKDSGMLFIFPDIASRSFWMKNTYIPLDIAFLDENRKIINICENAKPQDTSIHYNSRKPARYVIEVNGGWFNNNNISENSIVEFSLTDN